MAAKQQSGSDRLAMRCLLGGLSCAVPIPIVTPIEVMKIRLQLQGELQSQRGASTLSKLYGEDVKYKGSLRGALQVVRDEGLRGLYKGVTPSALRELTFSALRMGMYEPMKELMGEDRTGVIPFPYWKKIFAASLAGSLGAAISTPVDVLKVRMQAHSGRGAPLYKSTLHGAYTIWREEGFINGLYKGVVPNTQRAAVISAAMMPTYDQAKSVIRGKDWLQEGMLLHFVCSLITGLAMTAASSPFDVVKTRMMNQIGSAGASAGGSPSSSAAPYRGMVHCLLATWRAEGFFGLYKGFIPNYARIGPHSMMSLLLYERMRAWAGFDAV